MNNKVDTLAKETVQSFLGRQFKQRSAHEKKRRFEETKIKDLHQMWVAMNKRIFAVQKTVTKAHEDRVPDLALPIDPLRFRILKCEMDTSISDMCPCGRKFAERVMQYFHLLEWDFAAPPVSLLEIYIDYTISSQSVAPVLVDTDDRGPRGKKIQKYLLPDESPIADAQQVSLALQMRVWTKTVKWLLTVWPNCPFEKVRADSKTAHKTGFLEKRILGLDGFPSMRTGTMARERLWRFFHGPKGCHRSLKFQWSRKQFSSDS